MAAGISGAMGKLAPACVTRALRYGLNAAANTVVGSLNFYNVTGDAKIIANAFQNAVGLPFISFGGLKWSPALFQTLGTTVGD